MQTEIISAHPLHNFTRNNILYEKVLSEPLGYKSNDLYLDKLYFNITYLVIMISDNINRVYKLKYKNISIVEILSKVRSIIENEKYKYETNNKSYY